MNPPLGPPPVEAYSEMTWARVERGLWTRLDATVVTPQRTRRRLWLAMPLAAAAALALVVFALRNRPALVQHDDDSPARVVAGASASAVSFGDAHITLDAFSAVVMESDHHTALIEHGAAWFAVAPRGARPPFEVRAGDATVRVIGTRFRVARDGEQVAVAVDHGRVAVDFRGSHVELGAGTSWISTKPDEIAAASSLPAEPEVAPAPVLVPPTPAPAPQATPEHHAAPHAAAALPPCDADCTRYQKLAKLEAKHPVTAIKGYLELSQGSGTWSAVALFAAGRLTADRHDPRAQTLLSIYLHRFSDGRQRRGCYRATHSPERKSMTSLQCLLVTVVCLGILSACGGKHGTGNNTADASNPCGVFGTACTDGSTCCSMVCDSTGACAANTTTCSAAGSSCSANTDCCSVSCIGNVCSGTQCTADNGTCGADGECCGGSCQNSKCTPLNATCKTDGNPCAGSGDCCSDFCNAGGTCGPSSFCTVNGDACAHDGDCCGGICTLGTGGLGTCGQPQVNDTNCSAGIDGTVCTDCGGCCSRLCEVYGITGVKVCQPAEGCRVDGDICHVDSDCCGAPGTGLPGDGHVVCEKAASTDATGICRNPMACNPEGDICHFKDYATCGNSSARNDCCGGLGNSGVCQLDALGVPRCYGLGACQMTGQACAFSGDCCNGEPCTPGPNGTLVCGASCVQNGNMCTNTADCCNGEYLRVQSRCDLRYLRRHARPARSPARPARTRTRAAPVRRATSTMAPATACPAGMETGCTCYATLI